MLINRLTPSRLLLICVSALALLLLYVIQPTQSDFVTSTHPLVQQHINDKPKPGGRYYIPQSWLDNLEEPPHTTRNTNTILDAAELALELALRNGQFLTGTKIPLIIHQTWRSMDSKEWSNSVHGSVSQWLSYATNENKSETTPEAAYFLWDDHGIEALFETYQPNIWKHFQMLPYKVEKADAFRVAVLRWFGGVYADVDVQPLRHPSYWVQPEDIEPWKDHETGLERALGPAARPSYVYPEDYSPFAWRWLTSGMDLTHLGGVGAIFGIECDTRPEKDDYWRWGYSYPVQLTNWAMAMAPHHPIGANYLKRLSEDVDANATRLMDVDPLELTGPPALTLNVKDYVKEHDPEVRWEGLSGLDDPVGGRGKVVAGDVLVLPITGFSPGRSARFHNMGSQPVTHANARLVHMFANSWRTPDIKVSLGKFCRTFLGQCKDWKKIPDAPKAPSKNAVGSS